jgi:hypothetical protein
VPIGLVFAISQVSSIYRDRYLIAALPGLALLAGCGLAHLPRLAALAGLVLMAWFSLSVRESNVEQWREASAYASAQARPGDGWIFISKWGQHGFEYYQGWHWGRHGSAVYAHVFEPFDWHQASTAAVYRGVLALDELERFARDHPRIWLVVSHELDPVAKIDRSAVVQSRLGKAGYKATRREFVKVQLLLYERTEPARSRATL